MLVIIDGLRPRGLPIAGDRVAIPIAQHRHPERRPERRDGIGIGCAARSGRQSRTI